MTSQPRTNQGQTKNKASSNAFASSVIPATLARDLARLVDSGASNTTRRAATFTSVPRTDDHAGGPFALRVAEGFRLEAAMANVGLTWTEERIERLKELWTEGLSASQIAAELGSDVSRNAVISKANRLGLAHGSAKEKSTPRTRKPSGPPEPPQQAETPAQQDPASVPGTASEQPTRQPEVTVAQAEVVVPPSMGVTIMELREFMCRW